MKKITTLLLILLSTGVFAQVKGNIEFGFGVGYNTSSINSTAGDAYGYDYRSGYNVSAFTDFYFNDRWSLRTRVFFDRKGYDNELLVDENGNTANTDINLNYITIPVTANWHFGRKRNWYLNFGPYVGFLSGVKETRFDLDVKDEFNTTDVGLAVGIGVKIPLNDKFKFFIEYDYQGGFSDVFKQDTYNYYGYYGYASNNYTTNRGAFNIGINCLLK